MIGKTIDDFTILDKLGEGAFGEVYLAQQNSLNREVALKIFQLTKNKEQANIEDLISEAKKAASIQHVNIVNIYSVGQTEDVYYIAMEYINGLTLNSEISKRNIPTENILNIALQLCEGLQAILTKEIIHRDIKPENIILTSDNVVKITDFGTAQNLQQSEKKEECIGTPHFMSPEQFAGKNIDFRSDIYSLGATIYFLFTGQYLFQGDSIDELAFKHQRLPAQSPHKYQESISEEICHFLGKMIQKKPENRYSSYGNIIADIRAIKDKKDTIFANKDDAKKAFLTTHATEKNFSSIFSSIFAIKTNSKKEISKNNIIVVSRLETKTQLSNVSLVASISELLVNLKNASFVVFDSNYLRSRIVDFFNSMRKNYPEVNVVILTNNSAEKNKSFVSYDKYEELLRSLLFEHISDKKYLTIQEIKLPLILTIAKLGNWTANLIVTSENDSGLVKILKGKIIDVQYKNLSQDQALEELSKNGFSWSIENKTLSFEKKEIQKVPENAEPEDLFDILANKLEKKINKGMEFKNVPEKENQKKPNKDVYKEKNEKNEKNEKIEEKKEIDDLFEYLANKVEKELDKKK